MVPIRTQINKALATAAAAIAPQVITDPVTVYRNQRRPPNANAVRVWINIIPGDLDADDTISTDGTRVTEEVTVEGSVAGAAADTDADVSDQLDDLYAATVVALMADHTLGGLTIDVRQASLDVDYTDDEGTQPVGTFALGLEVDYETRAGDPYQLPA